VTHQAEIKLPTVSGSSGKLVIQHPKSEPVFADYPGAVFADEDLSYPRQRQEQMQQRQQEDEQWRLKREQLRLRASQIPSIVAWIAILVVV